MLVYLCSTLYHSLVRTRARHVFHILDHSSIYLLIAGTYTPFTLVSLRGPLGWTLFGVVWALAVAGVIFKSFAVDRFAVASAMVYLGAGMVRGLRRAPAASCHRLARNDRGWARAVWPTRWALSFSRSTACATSTPCGTFVSWPAASPTISPSISTLCPRGFDTLQARRYDSIP